MTRGVYCTDCLGTGFLDAIPLAGPGWCTVNLDIVLDDPEQREGDLAVPGADGVAPNPVWMSSTKYDLLMVIDGQVDKDGAHVANGYAGLQASHQYLLANISSSTAATDDRTRAFTYTTADGIDYEAPVHVWGPRQRQRVGPVGLYVVTLTLLSPLAVGS